MSTTQDPNHKATTSVNSAPADTNSPATAPSTPVNQQTPPPATESGQTANGSPAGQAGEQPPVKMGQEPCTFTNTTERIVSAKMKEEFNHNGKDYRRIGNKIYEAGVFGKNGLKAVGFVEQHTPDAMKNLSLEDYGGIVFGMPGYAAKKIAQHYNPELNDTTLFGKGLDADQTKSLVHAMNNAESQATGTTVNKYGAPPLNSDRPHTLVASNGVLNHYDADGNVLGIYPYTTGKDGSTDPAARDRGPIPAGEYTLDPIEISKSDFLRRTLGDWGAYRAPSHPAAARTPMVEAASSCTVGKSLARKAASTSATRIRP